MSDPTQRFFLQAIDPQFGCPVIEAMFVVGDISDLHALLGLCRDADPELRATYWLEESQLAALTERFGVAIASEGRAVTLCRWHSLRAVPYLVHTHYELFLLLEGKKKFACMGSEYPPFQHDDEELFNSYVEKGLLHKMVEFCPFPKVFTNKDGCLFEGFREVYYTQKGEEWRVTAWKMLSVASQKTGWNETCECIQGMLLGYEDWQINWWTHKRHNHLGLRKRQA